VTQTAYYDGEKQRCSVWTAKAQPGAKRRKVYQSPGTWLEFAGCSIEIAWQPVTP
jgi:hypothetical protein